MYRRKIWLLFHFHDAGIRGQNLYKLYCAYIRSCIEYLSPVYHSILHKGQSETLEKLHRFAVRICFGVRDGVNDFMQDRGIETLEDRRQRRVDSPRQHLTQASATGSQSGRVNRGTSEAEDT